MKLAFLAVLVAGSCAFAQHGRGGGWGRSGAISHPWHSRTAIVPYPVFYGGYYGYDPSYGAPAGNNYAAPGDDSSAPAGNYYGDAGSFAAPGSEPPVVVLNQGFQPEAPNPVLRDYSNVTLPPPGANTKPDDQATIYLIAMNDHTILPAVAYWVEGGDTLAYITDQGDENRVSLALVDRNFSAKLNADRGVEFHLPAAK